MNEVGYNQEFTRLELQYGMLKEQVANQLEMYTHLVEVVGPNLKSNYMMLIGQLEHRVFELKTEINRWKRRFTLRQQALNRGEKPDYMAIEVELDREFAEYLKQIKEHLEELKKASLRYHAGRVSDEEAAEIRYAYLNAVKKLHPDINPNLPASALDLWNQIQKAYGDQDWDQVRFLAGLVDNVVTGVCKFEATKDGIAALEDSIEKLRRRSNEVAERTSKLKLTVPFTYEVLLEDEDLVRERQDQLKLQVKALEECVREYEEMWNHGK